MNLSGLVTFLLFNYKLNNFSIIPEGFLLASPISLLIFICFQDLEAFGRRVNSLSKELENSDIYNRECAIREAWDSIDSFSKRLTILENEAQDLIELQELLEASVVDFNVLPT